MAGDWIKVESVTPDKPEVSRLAEILGISVDEVVGKLLRLWIWVDQQSLNGHAMRVTLSTLSSRCGHAGFADALREVGWLEGQDMALTFPNFDRHNGKTAKNRALAKERQVTHRSRSRNADGVTHALPEKRREEGYITTTDSKNENLTPTNQNLSKRDKGPNLQKQARGLLAFLNEKAERAYQPTDVNLDFIVARLKEGYTETQCRQVVAMQVRAWKDDEVMSEFLRPATLFNREKFNQYVGKLVPAATEASP
jgi:uncharacterized phage protein (TIGR02220 family)